MLRGADAYVLKSVIHDSYDDRATEILNNCHHAMADHAKLLLVERVMPAKVKCSMTHQSLAMSDLNMLGAGCERTEQQFRALLSAAGFTLTRIVPTARTFGVMEGENVLRRFALERLCHSRLVN